MTRTLYAGAARRVVNPPLGTRQTGFRLFGNPVQAIESDLTATALVLGDGSTKVVVIGIDLSIVGIDLSLRNQRPAQEMRVRVADALGIPVSHVLLNTSHAHSGVALPDYMPDTAEQMALKERYRESLIRGLVEAAVEADAAPAAGPDRLRLGREHDRRLPARDPRRARRARRGPRPPDRPLRRRHPRRRPRRQPDRRRLPLLVPPGHDGAPLRRRLVGLPGRRAQRRREQHRRARPLPAGRRRQHQPARRDGARARLPRHEEPRRARARRRGRQGRGRDPHEHASPASAGRSATCPNILFTPWEPVDGHSCTHLAAAEATVALDYVDLPPVDEAREILAGWQATLEERRAGDAREWEVRVAEKYEDWARLLVEAAGRGRGDLRSLPPGDPGRRHRRSPA